MSVVRILIGAIALPAFLTLAIGSVVGCGIAGAPFDEAMAVSVRSGIETGGFHVAVIWGGICGAIWDALA